MPFQTCITFYLLWKTKEENLNNIFVALPIMINEKGMQMRYKAVHSKEMLIGIHK